MVGLSNSYKKKIHLLISTAIKLKLIEDCLIFYFSISHMKMNMLYLEHVAQLLHTLNDQLLELQNFPNFHDADYCSINSVASVFVNFFNYLLPFIHRWDRNLRWAI